MTRISEKLKGLSLDRLETLATVVAQGGIARAACGDTNRQSLFSRQVSELEEWFGFPLMDRSAVPHRPTEQATRIASLTDGYRRELEVLREAAGDGRKTVVFGAGERMLRSYLIPWAARQGRDRLRLVFRNLTSRAVRAELAAKRLDFGILRRERCPPDLERRDLPALPMCLLVPRALAGGSQEWTWRQMAELPMAVLEGDGRLSALLAEQARAAGVELDVAVACSSWTQVIDAMRECQIAGIVPKDLERQFPDGFVLATTPDLTAFADEYVIAWSAANAARHPEVDRLAKALGRKV